MATRKKAPSRGPAWDLAIKKLESSGLTAEDLTTLRMEVLEGAETAKLHDSFSGLPALKLTYWDPRDLTRPLSGAPKWPPFYRLRYLREGGDKKDDIRYTNEPNAGVVAYFPPSVDWPSIIADPDATLIITEGELKAAKACREGFPCLGLGGVWNFRSSKLGITFLAELEAINWVKRRVYIVFDSDVATKPGVQQALNSFSQELADRGAIPFVVFVPEGEEGKKQGLDDWCVANPAGSIYDLLQRHQPVTTARKLFDLNDQFCYVKGKQLVIDMATNDKLSGVGFREAYGNVDYSEMTLDSKGNVSLERADVAASWLKWPMRTQVSNVTYEPGKPRFIDYDTKHKATYNIWPGWAIEPKKGSVKPFLQLLEHLFTGAHPDDLKWLLQWCAYPLQYPGTKLYSSAVLWGTKHGTGKSFIGYTLGRIYGKNFVEINQSHLHGGFNAWAEGKQLVMGDDVTGSNKRADNDLLKKLITQKTLRVNAKFMPEYEVPDCINYFFTSNHPDAFFLEDDDRRFFIHEILVGPLEESFYVDYELWLDTGGAEALFHYLLNLDLTGFNPSAPARRTVAKDAMMADTRSDVAEWVHKLKEDPDSVLRVDAIVMPGDLFTAAELLKLYDPQQTGRVTANGLSREMKRAAVTRVHGGAQFRGPDGPARYYAVRRPEMWVNASLDALQKQLALQHKGFKADMVKGKKF